MRLAKERHERFAQGIVAGLSAGKAYTAAGYKAEDRAADACAARLLTDANVSARIAELSDRAAATVQVSREWVLERLVENANRAMQVEEIKKADGTGTGEYKYEGNVANRALELVGKELGMFVDRKEVGKPGEFEGLTVEQKRERVVGIAKQLGVDRIGTPVGSA